VGQSKSKIVSNNSIIDHTAVHNGWGIQNNNTMLNNLESHPHIQM